MNAGARGVQRYPPKTDWVARGSICEASEPRDRSLQSTDGSSCDPLGGSGSLGRLAKPQNRDHQMLTVTDEDMQLGTSAGNIEKEGRRVKAGCVTSDALRNFLLQAGNLRDEVWFGCQLLNGDGNHPSAARVVAGRHRTVCLLGAAIYRETDGLFHVRPGDEGASRETMWCDGMLDGRWARLNRECREQVKDDEHVSIRRLGGGALQAAAVLITELVRAR